MTEYAIETDDYSEEPEGEVVQWMAPKPLSVGAAGLASAVAGAFVLGALTAVGVLAALHWIEPRGREAGWRPRLH